MRTRNNKNTLDSIIIRSRGDEALFVCVFYLRDHIFILCFKKKKGVEESVLLFWESVVVVHLRDSFVPTDSFANRQCLAHTHRKHTPYDHNYSVQMKHVLCVFPSLYGKQQSPDTISIKVEEDIGGDMPAVG